MFKLIRILNSAVGTPEPVRIPTDKNTDIPIGAALTLTNGVATNCGSAETPLFISASPAKSGKDESLLVYPVFDNMLFDAPLYEDAPDIAIGDKLTLNIGEDYVARGINAQTGGAAIVMAIHGTSIGDTVTVRFQ